MSVNSYHYNPCFTLRFGLGIILACHATFLWAQYNESYKPTHYRVLIVLDASGSMKEPWGQSTRWETARQLLSKTIDSLQRVYPKVEFGLRLFGHQSRHSERNCRDSKLEVPFGKLNASNIQEILDKVTPKGWTPIAYSLEQAAQDFVTSGSQAHNAIILITDGLETCNGDICAAGRMLQEKKISLKPYVIGLGLANNEKHFFDCVGKFFDVVDAPQFREALNISITQSLQPTTTQINLLNAQGKPTETDIELTIYDHYNGAILYNLVHTLGPNGLPDTLRLDPKGKYDVQVHSIPSVVKKGIELQAGMHNIISIDVPRGAIRIYTAQKTWLPIQAIIRKHNTGEIVYVQDINTTIKYITGIYDVEVLTLPRLVAKEIDLGYGLTKEVVVPLPGTLTIQCITPGVGSIYIEENSFWKRIFEFRPLNTKETLHLLPGKYIFVYRPANVTESVYTKTQRFEINSGLTTNLKF